MISYFYILVFILGLIIGSFLNCLIWRLYKDETLGGRSYCPHCRATITWYDNIPILSWLILGGRCRHCHQNISIQYPLVELMTAVLFLLTFQANRFSPDFSWLLLRDWFLIITLIVVFVYDLRWQLVPMIFVWPMIVLILVLNIVLGFPWPELLFFSALGVVFFLIQYLVTEKRGVGEGDIWLGLLLGLAFPDAGRLLLIMVISYSLGAAFSLILLVNRKKDWKSAIALGPFLALGAIITLIWGAQIINWYLHLFS
jgi:prepilin signal peptidase PulO-like enzyme (type II secretory pathway)